MWVLTSRFPYLLLTLSAPFHSGSLLFVPFPLQNITKCCEIFLDFSLFPPPLDSRFPPLSIVVLSSLSHFYCKILRNVTKYYKILRNVSQFLPVTATFRLPLPALSSQAFRPIRSPRLPPSCPTPLALELEFNDLPKAIRGKNKTTLGAVRRNRKACNIFLFSTYRAIRSIIFRYSTKIGNVSKNLTGISTRSTLYKKPFSNVTVNRSRSCVSSGLNFSRVGVEENIGFKKPPLPLGLTISLCSVPLERQTY